MVAAKDNRYVLPLQYVRNEALHLHVASQGLVKIPKTPAIFGKGLGAHFMPMRDVAAIHEPDVAAFMALEGISNCFWPQSAARLLAATIKEDPYDLGLHRSHNTGMGVKVGVLAIQGDFACHLEALSRIGAEALEVRTHEDLAKCSHLIIPGGESTTVGKLLQRFGLGEAIQERAKAGMPIWGTCMGMIMMAAHVEESDQYSLGLLDITVRRNAFGRQVHSFEAPVQVDGVGEVMGVFIRAPVVTDVGSAQPIATIDGQVVAVRQGNHLGTSFHPELTGDTRLHTWFTKEIGSAQRG